MGIFGPSTPIGDTPPGWILPGAVLDFDFANSRYWGSSLERLVTTRATQGFAPYAQNGGMLGTFAAGIPRITDQGLLVEPAATNIALRSRDFGNAAWVATNVTVAQTSNGADGVANGAARLTAGAVNATILQAVAAVSAARTLSFWMKRVTGTGTVGLCQDGVTFTDISAQLSSVLWTRPTLTATQLNPTIGIQFGTNGDAVDVDFAQLEAGTVPTSPIVTTSASATRNADVISMRFLENMPSLALYAEAFVGQVASAIASIFGFSDGTLNNRQILTRANTNQFRGVSVVGGTTTNMTGSSWVFGETRRCVTSFSPGSMRGLATGGTVVSAAPANSPSGLATLAFGNGGDGTQQLNGFLKRATVFPSILSDATMRDMVA